MILVTTARWCLTLEVSQIAINVLIDRHLNSTLTNLSCNAIRYELNVVIALIVDLTVFRRILIAANSSLKTSHDDDLIEDVRNQAFVADVEQLSMIIVERLSIKCVDDSNLLECQHIVCHVLLGDDNVNVQHELGNFGRTHDGAKMCANLFLNCGSAVAILENFLSLQSVRLSLLSPSNVLNCQRELHHMQEIKGSRKLVSE